MTSTRFRFIDDPSELAVDDDLDRARHWIETSPSVADRTVAGYRDRIIELAETHQDLALRTCMPGHLTGSALVVDPSRESVLLLFHTKLRLWLQPGGHADGDTNLAHVAWREATEETGIEGLRVVGPAIDIDIHEVDHDPRIEGSHLHLDVRFLVVAPPGAEPVGNHESQGFAWVGLDELGDYEVDPGTIRMARAGFAALAELTDLSAPGD